MAKKASKPKPAGMQPTGAYRPARASRTEADPVDQEEIEDGPGFMTVGDHLEELRRRIIAIFGVVAVASLIAGIFYADIHRFLVEPYNTLTEERLILANVYGGMEVLVKLSLTVGVTVSLPICIYIVWGFVAPAVERRTAWIGRLSVGVSALLFWTGLLVCWFYIFPLSLQFLFLDLLPEGVAAMTPVEKYYSFLFLIHIGCGLVFQLPLVLVLLGALGILTLQWHKNYWKYITVAIFIFAAIITPPDPLSQIVLGSMLQGLYFISVMLVWVIERLRRRRERALAENEE